LVLLLLSLSLLDSLATTQQIVVFALFLTTPRARTNALAFLLGMSGAYLACGLAGWVCFAELQRLVHLLSPFDRASDASYYRDELLFGLGFAAFGLGYFLRFRGSRRDQSLPTERLARLGPRAAFLLGAFLSGSSFPFAIPYLLALGRLIALHLSFPQAFGWLSLYGIGYALPLLPVLGVHLWARRNGRFLSQEALEVRARRIDLHLTSWTLVAVGLLSAVDAGAFFLTGRALLAGRVL
jgi:hypothetical protein